MGRPVVPSGMCRARCVAGTLPDCLGTHSDPVGLSLPRAKRRWPNPECAVGTFWAQSGVLRLLRRFPRCMFAIRRAEISSSSNHSLDDRDAAGTVDTTSWHLDRAACGAAQTLGQGTLPKYCSEQAMTIRGCRYYADRANGSTRLQWDSEFSALHTAGYA
jgi:hypothetical protein